MGWGRRLRTGVVSFLVVFMGGFIGRVYWFLWKGKGREEKRKIKWEYGVVDMNEINATKGKQINRDDIEKDRNIQLDTNCKAHRPPNSIHRTVFSSRHERGEIPGQLRAGRRDSQIGRGQYSY